VANICKQASSLTRMLIINFSHNYIEGDTREYKGSNVRTVKLCKRA